MSFGMRASSRSICGRDCSTIKLTLVTAWTSPVFRNFYVNTCRISNFVRSPIFTPRLNARLCPSQATPVPVTRTPRTGLIRIVVEKMVSLYLTRPRLVKMIDFVQKFFSIYCDHGPSNSRMCASRSRTRSTHSFWTCSMYKNSCVHHLRRHTRLGVSTIWTTVDFMILKSIRQHRRSRRSSLRMATNRWSLSASRTIAAT